MQRSYVSKTTINFANAELYVRSGDILVHDPANNNKLTIYRNGSIVKVIQQTSLGIAVMLKNGFIEPINAPAPAPAPSAPVSPPAKKSTTETQASVQKVTKMKKIAKEMAKDPEVIASVEASRKAADEGKIIKNS